MGGNTGEICHVHKKCTHVRDGAGAVVRSVGMVHDISQCKPADKELRRPHKHLSNIIDSMPSILVGGDLKTHRFILRLSRDLPTRELRQEEASTPMARMEIEDNGPGMDEAVRKRIFEPFVTARPTDRGVGLGLSVSYFITENHGGEMSVKSTPGMGDAFVIKLPIEGEAVMRAPGKRR